MRHALIILGHHAEDKADVPTIFLANALPAAQASHVGGEVELRPKREMRRGVAHLPRPEGAHIPPTLVLDAVQRLGESLLLVLIIIQGLQDAVFHISFIESIQASYASVAPCPLASKHNVFLIHASCLSFKNPEGIPGTAKDIGDDFDVAARSMSGN